MGAHASGRAETPVRVVPDETCRRIKLRGRSFTGGAHASFRRTESVGSGRLGRRRLGGRGSAARCRGQPPCHRRSLPSPSATAARSPPSTRTPRPAGHRGAAAGRQRGRRGRRHRRGARRHRALLVRHRRRRLLRLLRRQDRHRCAPSTAARPRPLQRRRRVHRPGDRQALRLRRRRSPAASRVGMPGTPATWQTALDRWGSSALGRSLEPAERLARAASSSTRRSARRPRRQQGAVRATSPPPRSCSCPAGTLPAVGSSSATPTSPRTYELLAPEGRRRVLPRRPRPRDRRTPCSNPPIDPSADAADARPGDLTAGDLAAYRAQRQAPTHVGYRGLDVYGMAPSSSGGTTVGEALNILERYDLSPASRGAGPAPLPRGERARVRRPRRATSATRPSSTCRPGPAVATVRRRAGLPDQPGRRGR